MILKRALLNGVQSEWSKQDDRFPAAHEIPAAHQTASKAASFESFRSPSAWLLARKFRWLVRDEGKIYLLLSCRVWKPGDAIFWTKIALESEPFEIELSTPPCLSSYSIVTGKRKTLQIARICRYEAHRRHNTPGKANLRLFRDFSGYFEPFGNSYTFPI